jgi:hypothetical protein
MFVIYNLAKFNFPRKTHNVSSALPDENVNIKLAFVMLVLLGLQPVFYRRIYLKKNDSL